MPTPKRFYPTLASVVSTDDLPEVLGFIKDGLSTMLGKIHFKDLQYSKSPKGDAAFYSLSIVSPKRLALEIPSTGIALVLNPDLTGGDSNISSFPITIEYQWKVLAYIRAFKSSSFSFQPQDIFELALMVLNLTEEQIMANFLNIFVVPSNEQTTRLQQFINDVNTQYDIQIPQPQENTTLRQVVQQINAETGSYASAISFGAYVIDTDFEVTKANLRKFFRSFIPTDIEAYLKDLLIPQFRATLTLSAGLEFPRSIDTGCLKNIAA